MFGKLRTSAAEHSCAPSSYLPPELDLLHAEVIVLLDVVVRRASGNRKPALVWYLDLLDHQLLRSLLLLGLLHLDPRFMVSGAPPARVSRTRRERAYPYALLEGSRYVGGVLRGRRGPK